MVKINIFLKKLISAFEINCVQSSLIKLHFFLQISFNEKRFYYIIRCIILLLNSIIFCNCRMKFHHLILQLCILGSIQHVSAQDGYEFSADAESLLIQPLVREFSCEGRDNRYILANFYLIDTQISLKWRISIYALIRKVHIANGCVYHSCEICVVFGVKIG